MKNAILLISAAGLISFSACGQKKTDVPANVISAFGQKFPTAQKVKWDKENATEWEAEFKMDNKEYSANFNTDGQWMETEYEISTSEIPEAVNEALNTYYQGYKVEEAEISETANGQVYEFEIKKDKEKMEVAFNTDGSLVKKEAKEKENNEGDDED